MIIINTATTKIVEEVVNSVDQLNELVKVIKIDELLEPDKKQSEIIDQEIIFTVVKEKIATTPHWFNEEPPCLIPTIDWSKERMLALIFFKLKNYQQALQYLPKDDELISWLLISINLLYKEQFDNSLLKEVCSIPHNLMMVDCHYGKIHDRKEEDAEISLKNNQKLFFKELEKQYQRTISQESLELKCYTAKYYIDFLLDQGEITKALEKSSAIKGILEDIESTKQEKMKDKYLSKIAINNINIQWATLVFMQMDIPYNFSKLKTLLDIYLSGIDFFEQRDLKVQAGLVLLEATEVATCLEDFTVAKNLIGKAIVYFKKSSIDFLLGEASFKKGKLFHIWSKKDNPQHYKVAINALQDALKVFKKEQYPSHNSDINHLMGIIYSEMLGNDSERQLWCSFSASSFKQALDLCPIEENPYKHAMICHNYATALISFPEGKLYNHFKKASELFKTALTIRTPDLYPTERALTLLNHLKLHWLEHNEDTKSEQERYEKMVADANEIKSLVNDREILKQVEEHLQKIKKLVI